jgi:hypothetical protein
MPVDLLKNQVLIEVIPDVTLILILCLVTGLTVFYWNRWRQILGKELPEHIQVGVVVCILVIFLPLWYSASGLFVNILTNVTNTEYAAIIKFNSTCGMQK